MCIAHTSVRCGAHEGKAARVWMHRSQVTVCVAIIANCSTNLVVMHPITCCFCPVKRVRGGAQRMHTHRSACTSPEGKMRTKNVTVSLLQGR